eukprot:2367647-Pleurochrysis_carterae.AAC.1
MSPSGRTSSPSPPAVRPAALRPAGVSAAPPPPACACPRSRPVGGRASAPPGTAPVRAPPPLLPLGSGATRTATG